MAKKSASTSALEELHCAMAVYFKSRLEDSTSASDDEDDFKLPLATGEVANIIAFLKHNNISAAPDAEEMSGLADEFAGDIEAQRIARAQKLTEETIEDAEKYSWLN